MKFKKEDLISLVESCSFGEFEVIEQSEWTDEGKYQYQETIFKFKDKFYSVDCGRNGSYYTDWNYDYDNWDEEVDCCEVVKKEKVTYEWVAK